MSWNGYIDSIRGDCADCDQASIIGLDGSLWTQGDEPKHFVVSPEEAKAIAKCIKEDNFSLFEASGIKINKQKYQFLRADEGIVYGKKKDMGSITLQKTNTAIVIGHTKEGTSQGNTNKLVGSVAEYLVSMNM